MKSAMLFASSLSPMRESDSRSSGSGFPPSGHVIVFENPDLLPESWKRDTEVSTARVFNPSILRADPGWILAYRVVIKPGLQRRIAICRLDGNFRPIRETIVGLTDAIRFKRTDNYPAEVRSWFADPRLYRLGGRIYAYWNSGWHEPQNHQFVVELDADSLLPIDEPRELVLTAPRQKIEKNWMLFESGGEIFAVYSINPHRILSCNVRGEGPIVCSDVGSPIPNGTGFAQVHGGLRGGAPPQNVGGHFWSFCHSIENSATGYRYVPSAYRFENTRPFQPTEMPAAPLRMNLPSSARRVLPKLNTAVDEVIYPAGAAYVDNRWVVSFGVDDERCALAVLDSTVVESALRPVG